MWIVFVVIVRLSSRFRGRCESVALCVGGFFGWLGCCGCVLKRCQMVMEVWEVLGWAIEYCGCCHRSDFQRRELQRLNAACVTGTKIPQTVRHERTAQ